jgi:hypothetical protein
MVDVATASGKVLAGLFGAVGRLRPADKPLHPRGTVRAGRLRRFGLAAPCGVAWLDEPGADEVTVRLSRAVGLPAWLPDVMGLAIRVPLSADSHADLLLASTGLGTLSRYVLVPARDPSHATYSTLLPYRTPVGPAFLAARPAGDRRFQLSVAIGGGRWSQFGVLDLGSPMPPAAEPAFDPMTNTFPDLPPYEWVARLREGAYRAARRSRHDDRRNP